MKLKDDTSLNGCPVSPMLLTKVDLVVLSIFMTDKLLPEMVEVLSAQFFAYDSG